MQEPSKTLIDIRLIEGPVIDAVKNFNSYQTCGAESLFIGRTRAEKDEELGELISLKYEMYEPMVQRHLERLTSDAIKRYEIKGLRLYHSLGEVPLEAASVLIHAISPHRRDALNCVSEFIEDVKFRLPIWKLEVFELGSRRVAGNPLMSPDAD